MSEVPNWQEFEQRVSASQLQRSEVGVKVGDGFDPVEIIFQEDVLVWSVSVFIRQSEADQHARNFEGIVHLSDEGNRTTLADEDCFFAKSLFERRLRLFENGRVERRNPGLAGAEEFEFAGHGLGQKLADMLLDSLGDFLRILIGNQARREFCISL